MDYNFRDIEKKWQDAWASEKAYAVFNNSSKPKYYVLDMFPYPSGAGLHVGHPLGYIASDIVARYKRLKGFNVLHPMGYDAFGLPAEQYAIEHGVHPAVSTEQNIANFRKQLDKIGFCFDWDRQVNTSDAPYYKWTQWIFLQLFNSWYNRSTNKTEPIHGLLKKFETEGNSNHPIPAASFQISNTNKSTFTADDWNGFDEKTQQAVLMEYRIAYCGYGEVNWCEALGTVLANDEVVNGVSERGGYPVVKKKLRQWYLRITEYADRLLHGLQTVDFSEAMKDMQTNWIGKSSGAEITFSVAPSQPSPEGKERQHTVPRYYTAQDSIYRFTKQLAEEKRKSPTHEEMLLWEYLRKNQTGFHIRRQHIIGSYIVDFACLDKLVTIEVDGDYHNDTEQKKYDAARTAFLIEEGFTELRYTNEEVRSNIDYVVADIKQRLLSQTSVPQKAESLKVSPSGGDLEGASLRVYTTRPDTIFGVDFMVLAPEHELIEQIITQDQKASVDEYIAYVRSRSERERMAEKKISGAFTGAYVAHPFTDKKIPVWISEYVLAGYGTGAIMAVPSGDERDHKFAQHFQIPITNIFGDAYTGAEAITSKDITLHNSDFLDGLKPKEAAEIVINKLEEWGEGTRKVNYKMRDAAFSRQRYWGEPFPIMWKEGIAYPLDESELPLELPHVESYKPGPEGEGPLANIEAWTARDLETNTMPGYAGSSWYFLRYMDPHNKETFCDKTISSYWNQVDLYVGGTEHAVGHLLYSRMWTKALYDLGFITFDEPFKKLLNQGMITGYSFFINIYSAYSEPLEINILNDSKKPKVYKRSQRLFYTSVAPNALNIAIFPMIQHNGELYYDASLLMQQRLKNIGEYIEYNGLGGYRLSRRNLEKYLESMGEDFAGFKMKDVIFDDYLKAVTGDDILQVEMQSEKMSKSKFNTFNPDQIVEKYGADTFRMYEMFLGPVEASKPWDTKGIEGVHRFLKKLWRLFWAEETWLVTTEKPTPQEFKALHKTIKKIEEDTERFSFNTAVSAFMMCVNELTELKCHKQEILKSLLILLTPYAPHIAEELYHQLHKEQTNTSILNAAFPTWSENYLTESTKEYPVSINGKMRTQITMALDAPQPEVEQLVLANDIVQKWIEGKPVKKFIFVPGKMVNVVV